MSRRPAVAPAARAALACAALAARAALACAALAACASLGCAGSAKVQRDETRLNRWGRPIPATAPRPPAWIDAVPEQTRTRFYGVGFSGATFWPQDAIANASEDARGKLALELSAHVEVLGRSVERAGASASMDQLDLTKAATDLVVKNSRIEATWIDERGVRGEAGSAWALAVLDTGATRQSAAVDATFRKGNAMPAWLDRLPSAGGRLYATGYSGPTFRPEAAVDNATEAAIDNLCAALRSHVQAYLLLVETGTGLSVDAFSRTDDADAQFKELVRKAARVEAVWVDEQGLREGDPPGSVWALAGIDVRSTKGAYDVVQNPDTGPALDAHGNVPGAGSDAPPPAQPGPAQAPAPAAPAQAPIPAAPAQAPPPR